MSPYMVLINQQILLFEGMYLFQACVFKVSGDFLASQGDDPPDVPCVQQPNMYDMDK